MSKINVTAPLMPSFDRYAERLKKIWESHWLTNNGQMCMQLQEQLEQRMDCQVELFVNGHMALDVAVKALGLRGEVITTPYTFASTTHALVMNGCTPVFCDIDPKTYTMDPALIEALITEKTCAIVPVHVYGCVCNLEEIERIAKRHNLKVIYDAAHAFGVTVNGRSIASFGDVSMFSFHATKVFNTIEGGALTYQDDVELTKKVRNLRNFGIENEESVTAVGLNAKMNELCAAMGLCNLELVDAAIVRRKEIVSRYLDVLQTLPGIRTMDYEAMQARGISYNYAYMPILVEPEAGYTRDELHDFLLTRDVGTRKYFYPLVPDFECYREQYRDVELPVARKIADQVLTLPLAASMTDEDVQCVCDALKEMPSAAQTGKRYENQR